MSQIPRPYWLDGVADEVPWDLPALVTGLSAFLQAHTRLEPLNIYQQALLLQASAQLVSLPCVRALTIRLAYCCPKAQLSVAHASTPMRLVRILMSVMVVSSSVLHRL